MVTIIITIQEADDGNVHTQLRTNGVQAIKPSEGVVLDQIRAAVQSVAGRLVGRVEVKRDLPPDVPRPGA